MLAANPVLHARTKHVEMDLYFVREKVARKLLQVKHVPTLDQIEDILTKPISSSQFFNLQDKLTVVNLSTMSLKGTVKESDTSVC